MSTVTSDHKLGDKNKTIKPEMYSPTGLEARVQNLGVPQVGSYPHVDLKGNPSHTCLLASSC